MFQKSEPLKFEILVNKEIIDHYLAAKNRIQTEFKRSFERNSKNPAKIPAHNQNLTAKNFVPSESAKIKN